MGLNFIFFQRDLTEGTANAWWLRSPNPKNSNNVFCVNNNGDWNNNNYNNDNIGVRPAVLGSEKILVWYENRCRRVE